VKFVYARDIMGLLAFSSLLAVLFFTLMIVLLMYPVFLCFVILLSLTLMVDKDKEGMGIS